MIERHGELILVNGEFISDEELKLIPQLAEYLLTREKAKVVVIFGIKNRYIYVLSKCRSLKFRDRIAQVLGRAGESRKLEDMVLAKIPLGIIATVDSKFKQMRYIEEIISETLGEGSERDLYERRLNEIKRLIVA